MKANPTRTLAALLSRFGNYDDFSHQINRIDPSEFFANADEPLPRSLNNDDNWLSEPQHARQRLGENIFEAFLPIYVRQLQAFVVRLLIEGNDELGVEGSDHILRSNDGEVRIEWGNVSVPQIESYFERYHSRAIEAVRMAGISILTGDHRAVLRQYAGEIDFERDADCFRVALTVGETRKLIIYAKTADRIRFEVRRDGRGRYPSTRRDDPSARLLGIIGFERDQAIAKCRWQNIGVQFDEMNAPHIGDLIDLISAIVTACGLPSEVVRLVFERLLVDGGLSPDIEGAISGDRSIAGFRNYQPNTPAGAQHTQSPIPL